MTRARDIANLVDANGDIVAGALDNANDASALTTGTLPVARVPYLTNRNLIIGGCMRVAQRGGSATTGNRTVDRFLNTYGDATITQSQDTSVPANEGFSNSYKHEVTSASSASGGFFGVLYRMEAQDIRNSGWDYTSASSSITLSFFAKASVAGTYMCGLQTHDGTGQVINTQYTLAANTWKKITATFSGNSNVTIDNDNGHGLTVYLLKEFGGAYTSGSTFDAWAAYSGSAQSPDANINLFDTANATFFVTGVQLEVGEQATPFEHRSFADQLHSCKRFYQKSFVYSQPPVNSSNTTSNSYNGAMGGYCGSNNSGIYSGGIQLDPPMRATPTMTTYGNSNGHWGYLSPTNTGTINYSAGGGYIGHIRENGFSVGQNIGSNTLYIGFGQWTAEAEL